MKTVLLSVSIFLMMCISTTAQRTATATHLPFAQMLVKDSSWQLNKAVELRKIVYIDKEGKKVVLQVLEARLRRKGLHLKAATAEGQGILGRQSVQAEMAAAQRPGRQVLAGVNADFFNMKTGQPLGPVIKEGQVLKQSFHGTNAYVGVEKSGRIRIGDSSDFKNHKHQFVEALGAKPLLILDKQLMQQDSSSLSTVHHPRTALGIKARGKKLIFLVVDGRQPAYSNGISLGDLSLVLKWLGATGAVNLDGGGSTTLVVATKQSGSKGQGQGYQVLNKPSDGSARSVANSWMIVKDK